MRQGCRPSWAHSQQHGSGGQWAGGWLWADWAPQPRTREEAMLWALHAGWAGPGAGHLDVGCLWTPRVFRLQLVPQSRGLCLEAQCLGHKWAAQPPGSPSPSRGLLTSSWRPGPSVPRCLPAMPGGQWPQTEWGGQGDQTSSGADQGKRCIPTSSKPALPILPTLCSLRSPTHRHSPRLARIPPSWRATGTLALAVGGSEHSSPLTRVQGSRKPLAPTPHLECYLQCHSPFPVSPPGWEGQLGLPGWGRPGEAACGSHHLTRSWPPLRADRVLGSTHGS